LRHVEFDSVVVDNLDLGCRLQQLLSQTADTSPAFDRIDHVLSHHDIAVVEVDPFAQRNRQVLTVVADVE
jgi:hypothetical protein